MLEIPLIIEYPMGNSTARRGDQEIILLCHGWPDSNEVWDRLVEALLATGTFICVRYDLPWYSPKGAAEGRKIAAQQSYSAAGYDFNEVGDALVRGVRREFSHSRITLICHDWGSVHGTYIMAKYPEAIRRVVLMDVVGTRPPPLWAACAMGLFYQYRQVAGYLVARAAHTLRDATGVDLLWLADAVVRSSHAWCWHSRLEGATSRRKVPKNQKKAACSFVEDGFGHEAEVERALCIKMCKCQSKELSAEVGYPYWFFQLRAWAHAFYLENLFFDPLPTRIPPNIPKPPILFLFGAKKPFMFHPPSFVARLSQRKDGSKAVGLPCGHWVQVERGGVVNGLVLDWLRSTPGLKDMVNDNRPRL